MRKVLYVSILLLAIVLAKREAPKETVYVEYEEWTYAPVEKETQESKPKEETYIEYDTKWTKEKKDPKK